MTYTQSQTKNIHQQTFQYLLIEEQNHILTITLNRPHKKNALNPTMLNELAYALSYAHYEASIWAVIIAASGTIFCAGADLKAFQSGQQNDTSTIPIPAETIKIGDLFLGLHKPCIAKVHAPVYAGGMLIIAGCTQVIATQNTVFGLPEVKRGLWPMQVMQSLLQVMPPRQVLDWCMTAKKLRVEDALKVGLVTQVADNQADLDEKVNNLVEIICQNSPSAIRLGLQAFEELQHKKPTEAHDFLHQMLLQNIQTADAAEGITAFIEKRPPVWTGQ